MCTSDMVVKSENNPFQIMTYVRNFKRRPKDVRSTPGYFGLESSYKSSHKSQEPPTYFYLGYFTCVLLSDRSIFTNSRETCEQRKGTDIWQTWIKYRKSEVWYKKDGPQAPRLSTDTPPLPPGGRDRRTDVAALVPGDGSHTLTSPQSRGLTVILFVKRIFLSKLCKERFIREEIAAWRSSKRQGCLLETSVTSWVVWQS